ncbi:hypothetical protein [Paraburkholderia tropica]|uniref:hypothetical protein n=1 Tax=Paraburkholderia tropica TaxID=92647 RepID=UPI001F211783|nr:hypothetical protein [Paraburkholderia tropica]
MNRRRLIQISALPWLVTLLAVFVVVRPAMASGSFDGNWVFKYSCDGATGSYGEQCRQGEGDSFALFNLTQKGNRICGTHVATAYGENKVDEGDLTGDAPSIYGTVVGNVATVQFRARTGALGIATITPVKGSLVWHVVKPAGGETWFPDDASLNRDTSVQSYHAANCDVTTGRR